MSVFETLKAPPGGAQKTSWSPHRALARAPPESRFGALLQRKCGTGCGCADCEGLQKKSVRVGAPDDQYEREADRIAERVVAGGAGGSSASRGPVGAVQAKPVPSEGSADTAQAADFSLGQGAPLPAQERAFFEPRLGHDLSGVRVHDGAGAAAAARQVSARAFTLGRDIVFGAQQYSFGTDQGRRLIAHELAHYLQQAEQTDQTGRIQRTLDVDKANAPGDPFGGSAPADQARRVAMMDPLIRGICPSFGVNAAGSVVPSSPGSACLVPVTHPAGCCCLCTLANAPTAWKLRVSQLEGPFTNPVAHETVFNPTGGAGGLTFAYSYFDAGGNRRASDTASVLGHELCGHAALMEIGAHPPGAPRASTDVHDPTVRVENAVGAEISSTRVPRGLAGAGAHRGESMITFPIGPFPRGDSDLPSLPPAERAKLPLIRNYLTTNAARPFPADFIVDTVGHADTTGGTASSNLTMSQARATSVQAALSTPAIPHATFRPPIGSGTSPALTGAQRGVEVLLAVAPAGSQTPPPPAPVITPVPEPSPDPARTVDPCRQLLASTAWP